ncbi:right-handed parallel beta-helix repeat-containing protein [Halobacillus sp. A5]|uniref:right-handed parallel beta-helix repeat-containing protein n=1 Tax=Halobacillus sp. A5 TaxID=2880263 RepID=UPI0020A64A69|nr:right-handed parallel beta-helix repeat-containing protein [Halobacillus sp. A5]MCP3025426.1 right-handed parallel beta-helix repeat-containing protein [Halobacillus sp. A5]
MSDRIEAIQGLVRSEPLNRNFSYLDSKKVSIGDLPFFNVQDYGAIGDGDADDTQAIQTVFDEANDSDGIEVLFPPGTYRVTDPLYIRKNTKVIAHNAIIDKKHDGTFLLNIESDSEDTGYDGHGNIYIEGGIWNSNAPDYTGGTAFVFGHGENITFRDITLLDVNPGHAIEFNACKNVLVDASKFFGMVDVDGKEYSEAIQLDLMKSQGVFPWKDSNFDNTPCQDVIIQNCLFGASEENGAWGRAVGSHSATADRWHERIFITNNIVKDCHHWAFRAYSWNDVTINDNMIFDCGGGISLDPNAVDGSDDTDTDGNATGTSNKIERFTIQGNRIKGGGSYGSAMSITGDDDNLLVNATISDNQVIDYDGGYALYISRVTDSTISNNILKNVELAIKLSECWLVNVTGNLLRSVAETGIEAFSNNEEINISGNSLFFVRGHGIWVSGNDTTAITSNLFTGIGYASDGDYQGVRVTTSSDRITINNNTFRNWGSDYQMEQAIYTSSSTTNSIVAVNNCAGISVYINEETTEYGNLTG